MVIILYLVVIFWVVSLFQFARLRISLSGKEDESIWLHKDCIFLLYMRMSGIFILSVIAAIIT
jgi:hypothetical protein